MKRSNPKKALALLVCMAVVLAGLPGVWATTVAAAAISTNGNGGKTDVGAWYTTYNTTAFWGANGRFSDPSTAPIGYKALRADGTFGLPDSGSAAEIDFQLQKMAEAGIDFIVFDLTNGGLSEKLTYGSGENLAFIVKNAKLTCERLALWNESHRWQIRYAIGVGVYAGLRNSYVDGDGTRAASVGEAAEAQAQAVKEQFLDNSQYGKYYYTLDGKPLLILHETGTDSPAESWAAYTGDKTYGSQFAVRGSNSRAGAGSYGWYTAGSVADNNGCGSVADSEVMLVCPGQFNHSGGNTTPNARREDGAHYAQNWVAALEQTPRIVMISSFNDYMEDTAVWPADTTNCTAEEHWLTDGKEDAYKYWDMTVSYIAQLRAKNGDVLNTADKRTSSNRLLGMTPSTPGYAKDGIANLTDGDHSYTALQGYVLYGAGSGNTNAYNETYYQFDFDTLTKLNQVKLYLSNQEPKIRPRDIAVDVRLSDGSWMRMAARYNIDYVYDNITNAKDGVVTDSRLEFNFPAVECTALRLTSNRQRTRDINNAPTSTYNWRLTEIEAYYTAGLSDYTGIGDPDKTAYSINALSECIPSRGQTVTTDSTHGGTKGLNLVTNNVWSQEQNVLLYFNSNSNTVYADIPFQRVSTINRVVLYQFYEHTGSYLKRNPRDVAIDVLTPDGEYVRVAERHNIPDPRTSTGHQQTDYYFPAMAALGVRVTYNKVQDDGFRHGSTPLVSPVEIQADYKTTVTPSMYTGIETATVDGSEIPYYPSLNLLAGGTVSSSNTNASLAASYPADRLLDGDCSRNAPCGIINYTKGLAYYRVDLAAARQLNSVKLYLSQYEPGKAPQDIGVDIYDGTRWIRVAEKHAITYGVNQGDNTLQEADRIQEFTFAPMMVYAVRIVAANARNSSGNFRAVELEAYFDRNITKYTGVALPDALEYMAAVPGDVNNDLVANGEDMALTRKALLGVSGAYACDANYDGETDIRDLVYVAMATGSVASV